MTVHCDRGIGEMPIEDKLEHAAHVSHLVRRQRRLAKDMGEAGGFKQAIALAKGQVEHLAQSKHRLAAGLGSARFDKAHMSYGVSGAGGQLELAEAPGLPP